MVDTQVVSQVSTALSMYDRNGDGKLNLEEFLEMLTNKPWSALFGVNESLLSSLSISRGVDGVATAVESPVKSDHDMVP